MSDKERIKKAKKELQEWIELHDGVVPSEDLSEFEKDVAERQWFIEQAEMLQEIRDEAEGLYADEIDFSDFGERVIEII